MNPGGDGNRKMLKMGLGLVVGFVIGAVAFHLRVTTAQSDGMRYPVRLGQPVAGRAIAVEGFCGALATARRATPLRFL